MLRSVFILLFWLFCAAPVRAAPDLARGTAILDPQALAELDRGGMGIGAMLQVEGAASHPLTNADLFALPSMGPVRSSLETDHARYAARHRRAFPSDTIGVGAPHDLQLFDKALLFSADTRFYLAGIVNRIDRSHVAPDHCGEVRLIYRLIKLTPAPAGDESSPRLPMTLNLVLRAWDGNDRVEAVAAQGCADLARRWLALAELSLTGRDLADRLTQAGGVLEPVRPNRIDRIETNLQVGHLPRSSVHAFRTDYLLKVFRYDATSRRFVESVMENEIDRDRVLADQGLRRQFRDWLLDPVHLRELDQGTIVIPDRFLATSALAATPAGVEPSALQATFGLVGGEDEAPIKRQDVIDALQRAERSGAALQTIRSVAGFERRLNEATCSGCHQTRGIGGFHFPGVDWLAARPSNDAVVPASPHFFGDQVRRRDILTAIRDGRPADFSRGFVSRPQSRGSDELSGTSYQDGWGAHCYQQRAGDDEDRSFASWTCAAGLRCQTLSPSSRIGMCFVDGRRTKD